MTDFYLAPTGSDSGSGSLSDPWLTIARAVRTTSSAPVIHLQPGVYQATNVALLKTISLVALEPGVVVEPTSGHTSWSLFPSQSPTWQAKPVNLPAGKRITQATWQAEDGKRHRIPVWNPVAPLDTPNKWFTAVLGPNNPHTHWGLYSTSADLYLIPPAEWADPNTVKILTSWSVALDVNGPDVTIDGIEFACHGISLHVQAARTHIANVTTSHGSYGIGIIGQPGAPPTYGHDHLIEHWQHLDNGHCVKIGETPHPPGQGISWNLVKGDLGFGHKALGYSETSALFTSGGATNLTVQDSLIDGSFDGHNFYYEEGRYDSKANADLKFLRVDFRNITDDAIDAARELDATYEDCTFENVGTVISVAPLYGKVTLLRCTGSRIGDQVRVPDGLGNRPPGSVVKCGAVNASHTQGTAHIEACTFWSDNPSTQGISQDGGTGTRGPKLEVVNSTIRAGYIVVNWPYPAADFLDHGNMWATSGARPLKTALPIELTPAAEVDARYYKPTEGDFSDMSVVTDLQAQLAVAQKQAADAQASESTVAAAARKVIQAWADLSAAVQAED